MWDSECVRMCVFDWLQARLGSMNTLTNLDELPCLELEDFKCEEEEEFDLCFLLCDDRCSSRSRRLCVCVMRKSY